MSVNENSGRTRQYESGDERLSGRILEIDAAHLAFNTPERPKCVAPSFNALPTTIGDLATHVEGEVGADFGLSLESDRKVTALVPSCARKELTAGTGDAV